MPATATETCSRCGHWPTYRAKPFAEWRQDLELLPLVGLYNLLIALIAPRRPVCSWCGTRRTPRAQASYEYDPFLHYNRHSRYQLARRRRAASLRPRASSGRWEPEARDIVLRYLRWRDGDRCGLCALSLPAGEGQIEHVVPKKFGLFDLAGGGARSGNALKSRLHHVDNLQASHDYCNRAKGNTASAADWRHPALPPLPVAASTGDPRSYLWVPDIEHDPGSSDPSRVYEVDPRMESKAGSRERARHGARPHTSGATAASRSARRTTQHVSDRRPRGPRPTLRRELMVGAALIAAGLVLLFVLMAVIGRTSSDTDPAAGSAPSTPPPSPAAASAHAPSSVPAQVPAPHPGGSSAPAAAEGTDQTAALPAAAGTGRGAAPAPIQSPEPGAIAATAGETAETPPPAPTVPTTAAARPEPELSAPADGWEPVVDGNASSYGEPDRDDLQWIAWQPGCQACEPGATLSWVGSYAHPVNRLGPHGSRPKLQSACLHRVRSGPLIDWNRDISADRIDALWVDGESVPPGSWWIGGGEGEYMVPEPAPFLELLQDARDLRVLTAGGHDATFAVAGFLITPVQANLDHCGHYP